MPQTHINTPNNNDDDTTPEAQPTHDDEVQPR